MSPQAPVCREHRTPRRRLPAGPGQQVTIGPCRKERNPCDTGPWSCPLKPLARAKSRLSDTAGDALRPGLALAFAQDTVAAALACPAVRGVAVVTDDPLAAA